VEKAPDAFRTISEVATDLNVPQHVLRFWESRFGEIKPMKRGGGRRYYRPDDVDLLRGIRHLLYGEGYTIRGVQRILKEQGLRYVQTIWQPGAQAAGPGSANASEQAADDSDFEEADARGGSERGRGLFGLLPSLIGNANDEPQAKAAKEAEDLEDAEEEDVEEEEEDDSDEDAVDDDEEEEVDEDDEDGDDEDDEDEDEDEGDDDEEEDAAPARMTSRPLPLQRNIPQPAGGPLRAAVSADDMRKLESALRELTECRRLLDAAIKEKV
jgi:DNA-binding transcriptional MerR regulator